MARAWAVGIVLLALAFIAWFGRHERYRWRHRLSPLWVQTVHDISYGPEPQNRLDILRRRWEAGQERRPAAVVFHGGGWAAGNRQEPLVRVCHRYLGQGFVVTTVDYRLGAIADAVQDAILALQWFSRHASEYGADPSRIVVTGESAGAHLALMAALRSGVRAAAVVNFYAVTDLTTLSDRPAIQTVLPTAGLAASIEELSPLTYVHAGSMPPVLSLHGTADTVVPIAQTVRLTRAIKEAGGDAAELYLEGAKHGFSEAELRTAYAAIFEFLRSRGILDR